MKSQSISINLSNAALDARRQLPSYWLTLEQVDGDDRISRNEVAELVDKLYDIEPCEQVKEVNEYGVITNDPRTTVYVTNLDLMAAAKSTIDIAECERRKDGTYRAFIRVSRSHEELTYDLRVSYGRIIGKAIHKEVISVVVDVEEAVSTVLKRPVSGKLPINGLPDPDEMRAEWLGPVYGRSGVLDEPPAISYGLYELQKDGTTKHVDKNLLHWGLTVTGSLLVEYETWYEIVEVEIYGIPSSDPYAFGTARNAPVVAFYHSQPYDLTLTPPTEDERADRLILRSLCLDGDPLVEGAGRGLSEVTEVDDKPEPEPEQPYPEREYGCEAVTTNLGDADQYLEKCCVEGRPKHGNCGLISSRRPADKKLSQETVDRMTGEWNGPIEFIGVGPCAGVQGFGSEGCGTLYTRVRVLQRSCCEDVEPLYWDMGITPDVLPHGSSIIIAWGGSDGRQVEVITSANGTWFAGGRKSATGHGNSIELFAGETFCGTTSVTVRDGCSEATVVIRSDLGQWLNRGPICALPGQPAPVIALNDGWDSDIIIGKYRQVEVVQFFRLEQPSGSGGCGGGTIPDCFDCVGRTVTCPDGQAWRSSLPTIYNGSLWYTKPCLSYGVDGWSACRNGPCYAGGIGSWQGQFQFDCGDNDIAMYGSYLVSSGGSCGLSLGNDYRFLSQRSITLYEWIC